MTTTDPRGTSPMTEPAAARPVAIRLDDLANLLTMTSVGDWDPTKHPDLAESWHRAAAIKDAAMAGQPVPQPEPGLPPGEFGRIELPGYRNHTGWVTDESRFGVQVAVIRDWEGCVQAEVVMGPACQFIHLPTTLRRPDPLPFPDATMALPAAEAYEGYYSDEDGHGGPADVFPGHVDPGADF